MHTSLSFSSFRPAEKRWNWRSLHILYLPTTYVVWDSWHQRQMSLICVSGAMQCHATSCKGRERANSGMEGQGRSCEQEAGGAGGERFAPLTIVIYFLSSLFLGSLKKARSITQLVLAGFVLICIQRVFLNLPCLILYT